MSMIRNEEFRVPPSFLQFQPSYLSLTQPTIISDQEINTTVWLWNEWLWMMGPSYNCVCELCELYYKVWRQTWYYNDILLHYCRYDSPGCSNDFHFPGLGNICRISTHWTSLADLLLLCWLQLHVLQRLAADYNHRPGTLCSFIGADRGMNNGFHHISRSFGRCLLANKRWKL